MRARRAEQGKGDKTRQQDGWPLIEAYCAPDDFARMVQFSLERRRRARIETAGLHDAADRCLAAQQRALRDRDLDILNYADALELYTFGNEPIGALKFLRSDGYAKQRQLEHSGGRPLAVCLGGGKRWPFITILGPCEAQAVGCFRIFEDSTRPSGRMWARLCPDCQPSKKRSRRRGEKALTDRAVEIAAIRARGYIAEP
jgi:hypothetical protein